MSAAEYYQQDPPQQSYASPHPPPQAYPQYPQPGLHHNKGTIHRRGRCSISNRHPRRRAAVAVVVLRAV
ncbi:hypothetical protein QC762_112720 [Podospora pseudocomata]|uniref:Uncharacterized protein n=1 Tax=Podospora pseudocomata TaxID=2093779 RepID=A0ABR0GVJ8_9PEZI|nr:hypothetical protein QC762_112720 [Podospora pseudocomata]